MKDTFAYTYAIAACPAAATATAESTIKEIAVGKQDEAPVKGQQGFSMGAGEYKFATIGGGHASFKVLTTVGGKGEFLKWGWMKAKIMSTSHTLQPPSYKFPKPFKSSTQSNSSSRLSQPDNKPTKKTRPVADRTAAGKPREGKSPNIHPEIHAHAYDAVTSATTYEAMVKPYEVIVGEGQHEDAAGRVGRITDVSPAPEHGAAAAQQSC